MPPALLLKGDQQFYGTLKPKSGGSAEKLQVPAPPPNPMSNLALTNEIQRDNAKQRLTENIADPDSREKADHPMELGRKDVEKLKDGSLGARITDFLQTPIVEVDADTKKTQKRRELERVTGKDPVAENVIRPVGEVPMEFGNRMADFFEKELMKILMIVGVVYVASQFAQGVGKSVGKNKSKE